LRNLALPKKLVALPNVQSMQHLASRIPLPRRNLKLPSLHGIPKSLLTSIFTLRFAWFSASLAMYGWFMFWIADDILVLHRAVTQVPLTNYTGALMAMALVWGGNMIFKTSPTVVLEPVKKPEEALEEKTQEASKAKTQGKRTRRTSKLASSATVQLEPLLPVQPKFEPELQPKLPAVHRPRRKKATVAGTTTSECTHRMVSSLNIPDACLTCKELIPCLSKLD